MKFPEILEKQKSLNLIIEYHTKLPLAIVNYHQTKTKRNYLTNQLRGICFDTETGEIIAKTISRFNNISGKIPETGNFQTKEDGTMILLYYYRDSWIIQCRHNFANDTVPSGRCTYSELFNETFPLESWDKLDKDNIYMFELCTPDNRIVQRYDDPILFLLTVTTRPSFNEIEFEMLNYIAHILNVKRPTALTTLPSFNMIHPTVEGFVGIIGGQRVKIKIHIIVLLVL